MWHWTIREKRSALWDELLPLSLMFRIVSKCILINDLKSRDPTYHDRYSKTKQNIDHSKIVLVKNFETTKRVFFLYRSNWSKRRDLRKRSNKKCSDEAEWRQLGCDNCVKKINNEIRVNYSLISIFRDDLKLNNHLRSSNYREAVRQMEKAIFGDLNETKRGQLIVKNSSNRYEKFSVEEQIDCLIDQATDVGILGRSWIGLETFMWSFFFFVQ